ncbi:MAG: hypothetical protein ACKPKO_27745, partial [Candidatus Fonsibacter sp.]
FSDLQRYDSKVGKERTLRTKTIADLYKECINKCGLTGKSVRCCPQCGHPILSNQCICLMCGMNATFRVTRL